MTMPKIIRNAIRCKNCGEVIEGETVHDFKFCSCGSCAVDGGHDYLRRCGNREDWEELSEAEKVLYLIHISEPTRQLEIAYAG